MNTMPARKGWGTAPFPVAAVAAVTLGKAGFLLVMGVIGLAAQDNVSDPWGGGMVALGVVFALFGWLLPRGIPIARYALALLAAASSVFAIIWAFGAPRSVVIEPIVMLIFAVAVIVLLFVPAAANEYFRKT